MTIIGTQFQTTDPTAVDPIRWSVMIPVHNCAGLLARALPQVVDQLAGRDDVEIVVVDDHSTDDPRSVVDRLGRGVVRYDRNPEWLGAIGTFNRCVRLARGELVHLLHGDDAVLPGFYATMEKAAADHPAAVAVMCRTQYVDDADRPGPVTRHYRDGTGVWPEALHSVVVSNRVRAPSIVVRRTAYAAVGPFRADLPHTADWEMWVRLLAHGRLVFVDELLACYRKHAGSDTSARIRTGANIRERVETISLVLQQVPPAERSRLGRLALLYSAVHAGLTATALARTGQWAVAAVQAREAVRCLLLVPLGARAADRPVTARPADRHWPAASLAGIGPAGPGPRPATDRRPG